MCNYKARAGLYSPLCLDNALAAARLIYEDKGGQSRKSVFLCVYVCVCTR